MFISLQHHKFGISRGRRMKTQSSSRVTNLTPATDLAAVGFPRAFGFGFQNSLIESGDSMRLPKMHAVMVCFSSCASFKRQHLIWRFWRSAPESECQQKLNEAQPHCWSQHVTAANFINCWAVPSTSVCQIIQLRLQHVGSLLIAHVGISGL